MTTSSTEIVHSIGPYEHTGAYANAPTSFGAQLPSKAAYANALAKTVGGPLGDNTSLALSLAAAYLAGDVIDSESEQEIGGEFARRSRSALRRLQSVKAVQTMGIGALSRGITS